MIDDFDRVLRESLQHRADDTPHVDLAAGALRQAGSITRRRRLTTGAGVLAVVALVLPIGIHVAGESRDHTASKPSNEDTGGPSNISLAGLPEGAAPEVPYIDGQTFRGTEGEVELPNTVGQVTDAVAVAGGALYWTLDPANGRTDVGGTPGVPNVPGTNASPPVINPRQGVVAWGAASGAGDNFRADQLVLTKTDTGQSQSAGGDDVLQAMGVSEDSIVYNGRQGKQRFVGQLNVTTGQGFSVWFDATYVTAVDTSLQRMAGHTSDLVGKQRDCLKVTDLSSLDSNDWVTCDWRPVEFSTDGSELLAIRPDSDGLGRRELAVLDSTNGDVKQVLSTDGTFGRATFEGSASVLAVLADGDRVAIVRCGIESGTCERATPAAEVSPDDPASLVSPYQLTAN